MAGLNADRMPQPDRDTLTVADIQRAKANMPDWERSARLVYFGSAAMIERQRCSGAIPSTTAKPA